MDWTSHGFGGEPEDLAAVGGDDRAEVEKGIARGGSDDYDQTQSAIEPLAHRA
jgi:hypothetical protein